MNRNDESIPAASGGGGSDGSKAPHYPGKGGPQSASGVGGGGGLLLEDFSVHLSLPSFHTKTASRMSWKCVACTYENCNALSNECSICGMQRSDEDGAGVGIAGGAGTLGSLASDVPGSHNPTALYPSYAGYASSGATGTNNWLEDSSTSLNSFSTFDGNHSANSLSLHNSISLQDDDQLFRIEDIPRTPRTSKLSASMSLLQGSLPGANLHGSLSSFRSVRSSYSSALPNHAPGASTLNGSTSTTATNSPRRKSRPKHRHSGGSSNNNNSSSSRRGGAGRRGGDRFHSLHHSFQQLLPLDNNNVNNNTSTTADFHDSILSFCDWNPNEKLQSWTCTTCTYINENPMHLQCEMCGTRRAVLTSSRPAATTTTATGDGSSSDHIHNNHTSEEQQDGEEEQKYSGTDHATMAQQEQQQGGVGLVFHDDTSDDNDNDDDLDENERRFIEEEQMKELIQVQREILADFGRQLMPLEGRSNSSSTATSTTATAAGGGTNAATGTTSATSTVLSSSSSATPLVGVSPRGRGSPRRSPRTFDTRHLSRELTSIRENLPAHVELPFSFLGSDSEHDEQQQDQSRRSVPNSGEKNEVDRLEELLKTTREILADFKRQRGEEDNGSQSSFGSFMDSKLPATRPAAGMTSPPSSMVSSSYINDAPFSRAASSTLPNQTNTSQPMACLKYSMKASGGKLHYNDLCLPLLWGDDLDELKKIVPGSSATTSQPR